MVLEIALTQISTMQLLKRSQLLLLMLPLCALSYCNKSNSNDGNGDTSPVEIRDSVIAQNLSHVWEMAWGQDDHIWFTERAGRISRLNPATGTVTPLLTITEVVANGEGGMLGLALHPNFSATPHVYVVYNYNNGGSYREKVVRYNYASGTLSGATPIIENIEAAGIHNGSRLLIVNDKLFITTGDAANQSLPQNKNSRNGKILRLNLDGSIPADNPVAGNPYWTFGHRNPQGLVYANGILYSSEHGPNNDDEVNIIEKGRNYGWPDVHGFCNSSAENDFCNANQVVEPIKVWTPTVAACGLDYYNSDRIPQWKNSLLMVTLKNQRIYQMKLDASFKEISGTNEYLEGKYGRLRDLCISPQGKVYIGSSNGGNDRIIEIDRK